MSYGILPLLTAEKFESLCLDLSTGQTQLIDVRAEVEFAEGSVPHSLNSPILNTGERALVGTAYKKSGPAAAIELGQNLVSGEIREQRIQHWLQLIEKNPHTVITCFRGGLRSKITQTWLAEKGLSLPRVQGGYKALRQFLRQQSQTFVQQTSLLVLSGATGSAKTRLLREVQASLPVLDLELAAHHRGSAFGGFATPQPGQIDFENRLSLQMLQLKTQSHNEVLIEDESRLIGRCVQTSDLFERLRASPVVLIEDSLEQRVLNTFDEYVSRAMLSSEPPQFVFERLQKSLSGIKTRLGGLRYQEIKRDLDQCQATYTGNGDLEGNKIWIRKLLEWYYDPIYTYSLKLREPNVLFRGSYADVQDFLQARFKSR